MATFIDIFNRLRPGDILNSGVAILNGLPVQWVAVKSDNPKKWYLKTGDVYKGLEWVFKHGGALKNVGIAKEITNYSDEIMGLYEIRN